MNTDVSLAMTSCMPDGRSGLICAHLGAHAFDRSSGLAIACLITPMLSDGWPL